MVLRRALLAVLVLCPWVSSCAPPTPKSAAGLAPVTLVDTAGQRTVLPDDLAHAKLTVIVFYADHCPCFRVHEERIRDLVRVYGPRGVKVLVVDSEVSATPAADAQAARERRLPAIALDPGAKLADALDAEYATYSVIFDEHGKVRYRGGIDTDKNVLHDDAAPFLTNALDDLLAGREPRVTEGKTLGCALQKR